MPVEIIALIAAVVAAIFSGISVIYARRADIRARLPDILIFSRLTKKGNEVVIELEVENIGSPNITIKGVALSCFEIWDNESRLRVSGLAKVQRAFEIFTNGLIYLTENTPSKAYPVCLSHSEILQATVHIEQTINRFYQSHHSFGSKFWYWLQIKRLKFVVVASASNTFSAKADSDTKRYLWEKYKSDSRLFGK